MSENEFMEKVKSNPRPVVVDFWATWCTPCKMIEPAIKKLGQEYDGRVDVWKVNADEHPDVLRQLRIYGIPTLIGFNAGKEIARHTGVASAQALSGLFDAALNGEMPAAPPITLIDRLLRVAIGLALLLLAYSKDFSGIYVGIAALSAIAFFSAIYDRCPLWQAIAPRLKSLFQRKNSA